MIPEQLVVLEMANNHMGDLDHGVRVISEFGAVCRQYPDFKFAFKLQYRHLDSFIHPAMKGRDDIKYIKRFSETRLSESDFDTLIHQIRSEGFLAMSTPFDNASIELIRKQKLDILKIASCSFNDWPLLEDAVATDFPIIASTAGADLDDIDRVISFLTHRQKTFAIMHCVGEYPTADEKMHVAQIQFLKDRYPGVRIGFSTHENPDNTDIVKMAIAKGATIFEKHVGVPTEKYPLNAYSANPEQLRSWLDAARYAIQICGVGDARLPVNEAERTSLRSLRRGIYLRHEVPAGHEITQDDIYFAFPPQEGQYTANDWSKYAVFTTTAGVGKDEALAPVNSRMVNTRDKILAIAQKVTQLIHAAKIIPPGKTDLEISHHYGLENFDDTGLTMLTLVNRGYCKKLLISLPGQRHPEQYHKLKDETFHVLFGEVDIYLNGEKKSCKPGDVVNVEPEVRHAFHTTSGCIIEEISSTHFKDDSFYTDPVITQNKSRKTLLTYWMG
jgi:sialic acid synthase SpsE/mannose-6-phosphate isomerase-like protein (cupin superfamily)